MRDRLATLPGVAVATEAVLQHINHDGRICLTQTRVDGRLAIRALVGSFDCCREDVMLAKTVIQELLAP